ncbi:MAG: hypothetical protein ACFFDM_10130, partial [Candidatus Thorarchaeota archaeon]
KSPAHEDWKCSPSFCSQRGGRGISLILIRLIYYHSSGVIGGGNNVVPIVVRMHSVLYSQAILAIQYRCLEIFPYFVVVLYVHER